MKKKTLRQIRRTHCKQAQGKVAVAMSGGVDSGMAAALLVEKGYQCAGFHLHLWSEEAGGEDKCCNTESLEAARKTAYQLEIPFYTLDFSKIFKKRVVDYFLEAYARGLTPNPCVRCNKFIKFGELLYYVRRLGYDYLATGHYARIEVRIKNKARLPTRQEFRLLQAKDESKDQSYFLYNLKQAQLAHILFPVGEYTKKQVRQMAKKWNLPVAERPESQEICFVAGNDYRSFLERHIIDSIKPGKVVDTKGRVVGRHFGLPLYTIGQRHGFEISSEFRVPSSELILPYYVIEKNVKKNRLVVGFGQETERGEFEVDQINLVNPNITISQYRNIRVRIRSQGDLLKAKLKIKSSRFKVILDEPERGIAPGQAAVFYLKELVLGGGIIV